MVDDEEDLVKLISYNLNKEGYEVLIASSGDDGLRAARAQRPDIIILDLMLPEVSGLEVCRALRSDASTKPIPIIMLTAKSEEVDKVLGLEMGADDYMTKPFSLKELGARIRAVLRRASAQAPQANTTRMGDIAINRDACSITKNGEAVALSAIEYKILICLLDNKGRVLSRDQILDAVWKNESNVEPRTVDVHIRKIRSLIEDDPSSPKHIQTKRGIGYLIPE